MNQKYHLFDAKTGKEIAQFPTPTKHPEELQFSPDGRIFGWTDHRKSQVYLAEVATGKVLKAFGLNDEESHIPSFTFSRDSRYVAYNLGDDPHIYLFALDQSKPLRRLHPGPQRDIAAWHPCLAFTADRRMIAITRKNEDDIDLVEVLSGQLRASLKGHQGEVASLLLSPDGRYLISGSCDTTALVWDFKDPLGKKRAEKLSAEELSERWAALAGSNAESAYDAILDLSHAHISSVPFLEKKLSPAAVVDPKRLASLITDLDNPQFPVRSKASAELEKLWDLCGDAISERLKSNPSLEVRRRLESLQEKIHGVPPPEGLRNLRALEVLEHIASPGARRLLQRLADGNPAARLTLEAREAIHRLNQSSSADASRK